MADNAPATIVQPNAYQAHYLHQTSDAIMHPSHTNAIYESFSIGTSVSTKPMTSTSSYHVQVWKGHVNQVGAQSISSVTTPIKRYGFSQPDPGDPGPTPIGDTPYLMFFLLIAAWMGFKTYHKQKA